MSLERRVARALTEVEYGVLVSAIDAAPSASEALVRAVKGTMNALMSDVGTSWDAEEKIDPTEWAIPSDQWQSLLKALQDKVEPTEGADGVVGIGLQWMNYGPSGFDG
jgi:hypothetical protein